jgi:thioredoxin 1
MSKFKYKALVVMILVGAVGAIVAMKNPCGCLSPAEPYNASTPPSSPTPWEIPDPVAPVPDTAPAQPTTPISQKLPRLVDLGADKCVPCKMMAPILEQLKKDFADKLQVDFIDVWKNPSEAPKYGIKIIPTQIFFGPEGKELFRHEGFFSREEILAKWKELGFPLQ